jgi:hypothetical protein
MLNADLEYSMNHGLSHKLSDLYQKIVDINYKLEFMGNWLYSFSDKTGLNEDEAMGAGTIIRECKEEYKDIADYIFELSTNDLVKNVILKEESEGHSN